MRDMEELSPLELLADETAEAEAEVEVQEATQQQTAEDLAAHRLAIASSYPRGLAILAWCRAHPEAVMPKAQLRLDRLRQAMIRGDLIADLMLDVHCWVLACPQNLKPIRPNLIPVQSLIDAEGVPTVTLAPGIPVPTPVNAGDALDAEILVATATPALSEN